MKSRRHNKRPYPVFPAILASGIAIISACSQTPTLKDRFQMELESLRAQYDLPGATAAFVLPDGTIESIATGMADIEQQLPMKPDTRMLAASIGKTFVGATVLALREEGALSLDDKVSMYLGNEPWFSRLPNHKGITLRQLLNHTSGIPNHVNNKQFAEEFGRRWKQTGAPIAPKELIAFVLDQPPLFEPGKNWHYTDTGYLLLGLIIESVAGRDYYDVVARRFLEPLNLQSTTPSNRLELPGLASGYVTEDNSFGLPPKTTVRPGIMAWHPGIEWTGGGLVSNSADLVRWARALYQGKAIKGDYVAKLLESVPVSDANPQTRYGIGVAIHLNGPIGTTYGHGGWIPGYCSSLRYYPDIGMAIAFQINTDRGIVDSSTPVMEEMELRLAKVVAADVR